MTGFELQNSGIIWATTTAQCSLKKRYFKIIFSSNIFGREKGLRERVERREAGVQVRRAGDDGGVVVAGQRR